MAEARKESDEQQKNNVIPLPKEREYTAIVDENDQITALAPKNRKGWGVNWFVCYQEAMKWLAKEKLPLEQYRVLMYMMGELDFENYVKVTQTNIGEALGMRQAHVSRAIRGLLERNVLVTGIKIGAANTYKLNPRMAYKGKDQQQAVIDYEEAKRRKESKDTIDR